MQLSCLHQKMFHCKLCRGIEALDSKALRAKQILLRDIKTALEKTRQGPSPILSLNHVALFCSVFILHNKFNKKIVNIYCRRCCFTYIKMSIELLAKFPKCFFFFCGESLGREKPKSDLRHETGVCKHRRN